MSDLNEAQRRIAETLDGMIVVDAGPGTGKTKTVVDRYVNLISQEDVTPRDVLMLTFTRNAAAEMEERIKGVMARRDMVKDSKLVQVRTFDAFCLSIVMDSPEEAGTLFGIDERLTHSARLVQNETLNRAFFNRYLDWFLENHGADYDDWAIIADQERMDLYDLINRLMARGIYPVKGRGWFGGDNGAELYGRTDEVLEMMVKENGPKEGKPSNLAATVNKMERELFGIVPRPADERVMEVEAQFIQEAAEDDREGLLRMVHDVYFHYIRRSIMEDRLTFGLTAMLAFSILFSNDRVRQHNSFRYVMIDEFQDTNASQLMMTLMILSAPNLCVVGDWKQGIYGFRYVSTENILDFDNRVDWLKRQLNEDRTRVPFRIPLSEKICMEVNYRSSQVIVDGSFDSLLIPCNKHEESSMVPDLIEPKLNRLVADRQSEYGDHCHLRYVSADDREREAEMVARAIRDYIGGEDYIVHSDEGERRMRFGDIAVLCRTGAKCKEVKDYLDQQGIPAFLQGDIEIMSTCEGKLALAWLRYVNNSRDPWGLIPIMTDMGYSMVDCKAALAQDSEVPREVRDQRRRLYEKRRRVTDLLTTLYSWYGIDNDITQAIINTLSEAHRGSLLTISDLISIIEDDIDAGSKSSYPVEMELESDAVRIMTHHKSKGLEFPAVILPYIDVRMMPLTPRDPSVFSFDARLGVRCKRRVIRFDGYAGIYSSWQTALVKSVIPTDYDEERRLMFVAMSRAKQYQTLICGGSPSRFMEGLSTGYVTIPDRDISSAVPENRSIPAPDISGYERRTRNIGVHTLMHLETEDGMGGMGDRCEVPGKGMDYGTRVHEEAKDLLFGVPPSGKYPESRYILDNVLSRQGMPGFENAYAEIECSLPVPSADMILRGVIDLIMVFEDRVEVHDYKTDIGDRFEGEYEFQLSVYGESAERFYGRPVECYIDYVSQGRSKRVDRWSMERISARAAEFEE